MKVVRYALTYLQSLQEEVLRDCLTAKKKKCFCFYFLFHNYKKTIKNQKYLKKLKKVDVEIETFITTKKNLTQLQI